MKSHSKGKIFAGSMAIVAPSVVRLSLVGLWLLGAIACAWIPGAQQSVTIGQIEWIDTHSHLFGGRGSRQDFAGAAQAALSAMDEAGIRKMVLIPPPQVYGMPANYDHEILSEVVKRYPTRFAFVGGGGSLNAMLQAAGQSRDVDEKLRREFEDKANEILQQGGAGFGEMTAHHLSHLSGHPYESVAADHALLLLLADIAARADVPIDLHFDVVAEEMKAPEWLVSPPNPQILQANLDGFERLLMHNRNARIVWLHAGSDMLGHWTVDLSRKLLEKHPNLYMSIRMAPGRAPQNHPVSEAGEIKSEWMRLLQDFSDRFVIGADQFFASPSLRGDAPALTFAQRAPMIRDRTRMFLGLLPGGLYRKVALENPARVYRLED